MLYRVKGQVPSPSPVNWGAKGRVIPAKAGIHLLRRSLMLSSPPKVHTMDSRFRGNDEWFRYSRLRGMTATALLWHG